MSVSGLVNVDWEARGKDLKFCNIPIVPVDRAPAMGSPIINYGIMHGVVSRQALHA